MEIARCSDDGRENLPCKRRGADKKGEKKKPRGVAAILGRGVLDDRVFELGPGGIGKPVYLKGVFERLGESFMPGASFL